MCEIVCDYIQKVYSKSWYLHFEDFLFHFSKHLLVPCGRHEKACAVSTQHRSQNITNLPVSHTSFLATIHMLSRTAAHDAVSMLDVRT